jgi:hypothetical protein
MRQVCFYDHEFFTVRRSIMVNSLPLFTDELLPFTEVLASMSVASHALRGSADFVAELAQQLKPSACF